MVAHTTIYNYHCKLKTNVKVKTADLNNMNSYISFCCGVCFLIFTFATDVQKSADTGSLKRGKFSEY
jgi:hypothetical protein